MVLQERIELSTSPLPRECSTTELLQRRAGRNRRKARAAQAVKMQPFWTPRHACAMNLATMEKPGKSAPKPQRTAAEIREQRLKAALKANMAKRKAQAKERAVKACKTA